LYGKGQLSPKALIGNPVGRIPAIVGIIFLLNLIMVTNYRKEWFGVQASA